MLKIPKLNSILPLALTSAMILTACGSGETVDSAPSGDPGATAALNQPEVDTEPSTTEDTEPEPATKEASTIKSTLDKVERKATVPGLDNPADSKYPGTATGQSAGATSTDGTSADNTATDSTDTDSTATALETSAAPGSDSEATDAAAELQLVSTLAALGIKPDSEAGQCMRKNKDLIVNGTGPGDLVYVAAKCAPEEVAATITASQTLGDLTPEETTCVMTESLTYIADLPPTEARAAFGQDQIPAEYAAVIVPLAEKVCGVEAERFAAEFTG